MKGIVTTLLISLIGLNADTCVGVIDRQGAIKLSMKIEYCDNNLYKLRLKNTNKFLDNYIENLTEIEIEKLIEAYKKSIQWLKKAKEERIDLNKDIEIKDKNLVLNVNVDAIRNKGTVLLIGINSVSEKGMFGVTDEIEVQDIIKTLENGKNLAKRKLEYIEKNFK